MDSIKIITITGKTINYPITTDIVTCKMIKTYIESVENIPIDIQKIVQSCKKLEDDAIVESLILYLVLDLRGGMFHETSGRADNQNLFSPCTVTYHYEDNLSYKKKEIKYVHNQSIIDGEKGLSFHFLKKEGDDESKFYKINVREINKNKFHVEEEKNDKEDKIEISMEQLLKMVKSNKDLAFVDNYLTKERGNYS